jgi:hypothetical protein
MASQTFRLTADHIKLLRNMCVGWRNCETGAPEIDPKRPYGNSDVAADIHELLTGAHVEELTEEEQEKYLALHRETERALQVFLNNAKILPGVYTKEWTGWWEPLWGDPTPCNDPVPRNDQYLIEEWLDRIDMNVYFRIVDAKTKAPAAGRSADRLKTIEDAKDVAKKLVKYGQAIYHSVD